MDILIHPQKLHGSLTAIPSKSHAHRLLICASFSDKPTVLKCPETNHDIEATAQCLRAIGADISRTHDGYRIEPILQPVTTAILDCGESGSTLRFMLPIIGALGIDGTFVMGGRLPQRPLSPLWEEMERMGCNLTRPSAHQLRCTGRLRPGQYRIDGSVSSQFITGLLYAMALIPGSSELIVTGRTESRPYINMTCNALNSFGVRTQDFRICGSFPFSSPGFVDVEGDWSNAAFFLCAAALGSNLSVSGLQEDSAQGDREVVTLLPRLDRFAVIDAADIPDLVPILAVTAGAKHGARFENIQRLRLKESDRVASVAAMLNHLGAKTIITDSTLTVHPAPYRSCSIDAVGDHRIAMSAAIAATVADGPITVLGAQCVSKSYPKFWEDYRKTGGTYEQYIR